MLLGKAFGGRAFEGMAMYFEVNGQALVEVGKTTEMFGSAREGAANFLDELERTRQGEGMALPGKSYALG